MWAETDDLAPVSPERGFSLAQCGPGAPDSLTSYGRETPMISRRSADDLGSLHLRDMASPSEGRSREDCVRAAVACVRIEGGEVDAETQALLDRWGGGALSDSDLMEAILAPYVARR